MLSKKQAAEAVRTPAEREAAGVTWSQLADAVGRPVAWTTSALLGQQPMTAGQAKAACSLLELGEDVLRGLAASAQPGALETRGPGRPDDLPVLRGAAGLRPHHQGAHSRGIR